MPLRVVLDTDPGIDDSLAILLALASPEIDLAGVCVTGGNCPLEDGVRNALNVLAVAGRPDMPVHAGIGHPLIRPPFTAPETHGDTGLGYARLPASPAAPASEHAVDTIIREIMARPGEVTLVAVAPLTNVAVALRKEPRIVQNVREVIIMGAALRADGNTTSLAEFNFYVDPHAAHIVLESGMPITLLPWDITKDVLLTQADVDRLLALPSPVTRFIADATRFYIEFHEACFGFSGCSINDPVALALAFMPGLARTQAMHVAVEYSSELTAGKSVISYVGDHQREPDAHDQLGFDVARWPMQWGRQVRSKPNVRAVVEFDSAGFIELFVERMEHLAAGRPASDRRH
ncbi:MAG TPA: nucleoside hydrolase [Kouleothrix sp.]|uniref:nucleoside hydrolase n=1 Tax=Kouleothrix sp. TaxID=2779161 RepID=UPI002CD86E34|nr:nucleoside hydrolase [Kouleothrix sp.]HRC74346.1 nucleoside hydrolase [Kouleothrix sp.]